MCFSAGISYGAAVLLAGTGGYVLKQARQLPLPYWMLASTPLLFAIQQAMEGRVWQLLNAGSAEATLPFAMGFHFFSHFLWLWWFPLASFLLEPERGRRRLFIAFAIFGAVSGGLVYFMLLLHPQWMAVTVEGHSIVYSIQAPSYGQVNIPIPASALYAFIVLLPLLSSSLRDLRLFGSLVALSMVLTSIAYGDAFVSVWCLFAAILSFYLVYMVQKHRARMLGV